MYTSLMYQPCCGAASFCRNRQFRRSIFERA